MRSIAVNRFETTHGNFFPSMHLIGFYCRNQIIQIFLDKMEYFYQKIKVKILQGN